MFSTVKLLKVGFCYRYAIDCEEEFTCVTGTVYNPNSKLPTCKPKLCEKQEIKNGNITGPDPVSISSLKL